MDNFKAKKFKDFDNEYWVGELDEEGHYNSLAMCYYDEKSPSIYFGEVKNDNPNGFGMYIGGGYIVYAIGDMQFSKEERRVNHGLICKNGKKIIRPFSKNNKHLIVKKEDGSWLYGFFVKDPLKVFLDGSGYYYDSKIGILFYIECADGKCESVYPILNQSGLQFDLTFYYCLVGNYSWIDFRHNFAKRVDVNKQNYNYEYSGMIHNGEKDGFGCIHWSDGDKFIGTWKNGYRNFGCYYFKDGTKEYLYSKADNDAYRDGWTILFTEDGIIIKFYKNDIREGQYLVIGKDRLKVVFDSDEHKLVIHDNGISLYQLENEDYCLVDEVLVDSNYEGNSKFKDYANKLAFFSRELKLKINVDKNMIKKRIEEFND